MKKLYDLAVKTGSYETQEGTKSRWQNVGSVMENDEGGKFIFLNRSFNPAGIPFKEGSTDIILSMFTPKEQN